MKKFVSVFLVVILVLLSGIPAFAAETVGTDYYIDSVCGDDGGDGLSPDTAWKSLDRASHNTYGPGDRILLKCGETYKGTFLSYGIGSKDAPVTVSSYGEGERPVVCSEGAIMGMLIFNVSNWVIENIGFTSPEGSGLYIMAAQGGMAENITVRNCAFFDISPDKTDTSSAALTVNNDSSGAKLKNIHLDSLTFNNVSWAVHTNGLNVESSADEFVSPGESYNSDYLFENLYIKNAACGGIVIAAVQNCVVRNCRVLDSATVQNEAYAPLWIRHSDNVLIEYCEIAGSTNPRDGMAIDFDGWTTNSTYRYIYSHDNNRFIKNCVYDSDTHNAGNSVYNCLSVNDNGRMNFSAVTLISMSRPSLARMRDFSFSDSVIINGRPIFWLCSAKPKAENIRFSCGGFMNFLQRIFNLFYRSVNFIYEAPSESELDSLINEITGNLPDGSI